jgi:serine/threonine protein phosphatase PrpC
MSSSGRPAPFPPGTKLGEHFVVDSLRRLCEGRMIYVVNDNRPDQPTRKCWECRNNDSPRSAAKCVGCGKALPTNQQFILSARWDSDNFKRQLEFHQRKLQHPAMLRPDAVFLQDEQLCSVIRYKGESLMVTLPAPMETNAVMHLTQRFTGLIAFFHRHGVRISKIDRHAFMLRKTENKFLMFDPLVTELKDEPIEGDDRVAEIKQIAAMMRKYTQVNCNPLHDFLLRAEQGEFESPMAFGRSVEKIFDTTPKNPALEGVATMTDVGLARSLNEDTWAWTDISGGARLYAVADGMGGHDAGEVASATAVATICREARERFDKLKNRSHDSLENLLDESFQAANNAIKQMADDAGTDMGTTMTAMLHCGDLGLLANVGDSRIYLMRDQSLQQVSQDHSLVGRLMSQGRITADEARTHPHSHILLRTVGTEYDVEIDIFQVALQAGDRVIMCSDGLWGEVEDDDMEAILNHYDDPSVCVQELIKAAHLGGGKDNVTVMIIGT